MKQLRSRRSLAAEWDFLGASIHGNVLLSRASRPEPVPPHPGESKVEEKGHPSLALERTILSLARATSEPHFGD